MPERLLANQIKPNDCIYLIEPPARDDISQQVTVYGVNYMPSLENQPILLQMACEHPRLKKNTEGFVRLPQTSTVYRLFTHEIMYHLARNKLKRSGHELTVNGESLLREGLKNQSTREKDREYRRKNKLK